MKTYIINGIVALLLIIGVGLVVPKSQPAPQQSNDLSGLSERDIQAVSLKVASNGTKISKILVGSCTLLHNNQLFNATTSKAFDCRVVGARTGDYVFGSFATTTGTTNGWKIDGVSASTTADYITFKVSNSTGADGILPASVASTTRYLIVK